MKHRPLRVSEYWYIRHVDEGPLRVNASSWMSVSCNGSVNGCLWDVTHFVDAPTARASLAELRAHLTRKAGRKFRMVHVRRVGM
jgi:hypothetical protein